MSHQSTTSFRNISKPGEIGAEYKLEQDKICSKQTELEKQSLDFIKNLMLEEEKEVEKKKQMQKIKDEEMAKKLHYELNKTDKITDHFAKPVLQPLERSNRVTTRSSAKRKEANRLPVKNVEKPKVEPQKIIDTSTPLKPLTKSTSIKRRLSLLSLDDKENDLPENNKAKLDVSLTFSEIGNDTVVR